MLRHLRREDFEKDNVADQWREHPSEAMRNPSEKDWYITTYYSGQVRLLATTGVHRWPSSYTQHLASGFQQELRGWQPSNTLQHPAGCAHSQLAVWNLQSSCAECPRHVGLLPSVQPGSSDRWSSILEPLQDTEVDMRDFLPVLEAAFKGAGIQLRSAKGDKKVQ